MKKLPFRDSALDSCFPEGSYYLTIEQTVTLQGAYQAATAEVASKEICHMSHRAMRLLIHRYRPNRVRAYRNRDHSLPDMNCKARVV